MSHPVSWPLRMIDWYQRSRHGQPSPCRFTPSCSEFAREAFELYGTRHGLWLTLRRLLRCRPFGPSGYDPVPFPRDPGTVPPTSGPRRLRPLRGFKAREDLMTR